MKSSKLILALWLGASAWAQVSPQKQPVSPPPAAKQVAPAAAKPGVAKPASPQPASPHNAAVQSGKPVPPPAKPAAAVRPARKPSARPVVESYGSKPKWKRRAARPHSAEAATAQPKKVKVQRDPFVSPVVERIREVATCTGTGRQCLLVGEVSLSGVVRSPNGYIAVVVNGEHTYFLRENDPLADGAVERITNDAIILRERSSDAGGHPIMREVTKKVGAVPAV
jgi:hypothetical protein